jgi:hypothetical protein
VALVYLKKMLMSMIILHTYLEVRTNILKCYRSLITGQIIGLVLFSFRKNTSKEVSLLDVGI